MPADERWPWVSPQPVEALPGRTVLATLAITTHERTVRLVDAGNGESLSGVEVAWTTGGVHALAFDSATTDEAGRISLTLPEGQVRFHAGSKPHGRFTAVEWAPGDDELSVEFTVHRP